MDIRITPLLRTDGHRPPQVERRLSRRADDRIVRADRVGGAPPDHQNIDAFLDDVLHGMQSGRLDLQAARQVIAHVMRCMANGQHGEARVFIEHVTR